MASRTTLDLAISIYNSLSSHVTVGQIIQIVRKIDELKKDGMTKEEIVKEIEDTVSD